MSALAAIREAAERLAEADEDERAVRLRPEAKRLGVRINYLEAAIRRRQAAQEAEAEAAPEQPNSELAPEDPDLVVVDQPGETDAEAIARLARMPVLEYERQRDAAAALLGIPRVAILDRFVNAARRSGRNAHDEQRTLQGHALVMIEPAPWPQPVNGAALLDEVAASISRHVVLPTGGSVAVALWCVHTFLLDAFRHSPRLAISSSDPDCGKTTLLDIVALLIFRPLSTSGISSAAFYRTVERAHPSLLADEADSWLHENEELRGCLNAGHKRGGRMIKCVGEDFEPRAFDVFCALAIAMIGLPPATVLSRSISIRMRRASPADEFQPLTETAEQAFAPLVRKIARWAADNAQAVAEATPDMPPQLVNRKGDNWRPLFMIAAALGGGWPERLKNVAATLLAEAARDPQSLGVMVLEDIRALFHQRGDPPHLPSADILAELLKLEDRPWGALGKVEKPLTVNRLSRLLGPYAIAPGTIRVGERDTPKGYRRAQFEDAWKRYLQPSEPPDAANADAARSLPAKKNRLGGFEPPHRHKPQETAVFSEFSPPQNGADVAVRNPENPRKSAICGTVADQMPPEGALSGQDDRESPRECGRGGRLRAGGLSLGGSRLRDQEDGRARSRACRL